MVVHTLHSVGANTMDSVGEFICLVTKHRLYETCVLSVLLYSAEAWTLLKADVNRLQTA